MLCIHVDCVFTVLYLFTVPCYLLYAVHVDCVHFLLFIYRAVLLTGWASYYIQWNPSCEATPFAQEKWPYKRGGLLSGVEIHTFMFRFTWSSGLFQRGWPLVRVASQKGFHCIHVDCSFLCVFICFQGGPHIIYTCRLFFSLCVHLFPGWASYYIFMLTVLFCVCSFVSRVGLILYIHVDCSFLCVFICFQGGPHIIYTCQLFFSVCVHLFTGWASYYTYMLTVLFSYLQGRPRIINMCRLCVHCVSFIYRARPRVHSLPRSLQHHAVSCRTDLRVPLLPHVDDVRYW